MELIKMLFGCFDLVLIVVLIFLNYRFWKNYSVFNNCFPTVIFFLSFGFILPVISIIVEIKVNSSPGDDSFNLLYTYFRFPVYWVIGLVQLLIINYRINRSK